MPLFPDGFIPRIASDFFIPTFAPRTHPLPRPTVDFDAEPAVYWKINRTWLGHVTGAVDLLTQADSWIGTPEQVFQTTQQAMRLIAQDVIMSMIFDLQQTGILIEKQGESGGVWSTLYDPRPYVLIKAPTAIYHNTVNAPSGVAGMTLLSVVGNRANADDAVLYVVPGWNAPAAIFRRNDITGNETVRIEHNLTGGVGVPDFLRAMDTDGNKFGGINPYGNIALRRYTSSLPAASAAHYGSLAMLGNGSTDNALWYCDYNVAEAEYYWRKGVGEPGVDGHSLLLNFPSVEVINPNEPPDIEEEESDNNATLLTFHLPRAPQLSKLPDIIGTPGVTSPGVAMAETTEGDYTLQFTVVAGENGGGGGGQPIIDEVLPALGETKDLYTLAMADSGTIGGVVLNTGMEITEIEATGLWSVGHLSGNETVTDAEGFTEPSYFVPGGHLMLGVKPVGSGGAWDFASFQALPLSFESPVNIKFAQNRNVPGDYGVGLLKVRYRVARGNYTWRKVLDFTEDAHSDIVYDQDSSVTYVSGEGYVTDGGLWYARLSIGIVVDEPSTLVNIRTEMESVFTEPGSGWNNLDKVSVNRNGTLTTYNEAFDYPISNKLRVVDLALPDAPLSSIIQIGADTRAVTGETGVLTIRRFIIEGTGKEPEWITF